MSYTPGQLPLGAVIATFPHLTNAYQCSATTTPDAKGFVLCQGQTLVAGSMTGAVVPNINNNVFLRGNSTSSGTVSGASAVTLSSGNIPQVSTAYTPAGSVDISHTHGASSVTGTVDSSALGTHTHSFSGTTGNNNSSLNHDHTFLQLTFFGDAQAGSPRFAISGTVATNTGGNNQSLDHTHNFSGTTGDSPSLTHSHTFSSGSAAGQTLGATSKTLTGTGATITVGSSSPTSFDILPPYINAVYLMRVN
jgi:hypothetical protein